MREKLLTMYRSRIYFNPKNDSRILFLGTARPPSPYIVNSQRETIVRSYGRRGIRDNSNYEGLLAPQLEDIDSGASPWLVTDPDRFGENDLLEREASMGRSNFMLQFMSISLSDAEKFSLKMSDLIITSVNPSHQVYRRCSDPSNVIKLPLSVYLEIISTVQCHLDLGNGHLTPKQSAALIRRVVAQMKQQRLISPNTMVSCTCTKCELIETTRQNTS